MSNVQIPFVPNTGATYNSGMRIIARRTLRSFWEKYPDSEQPLRAWFARVKKVDWKTPAEVKVDYRNASFVANNRTVFNIKGNDYRLVVAINYESGIVYIRFVGTHREYNKIDVNTI
jgi:mRNA interferase HigB